MNKLDELIETYEFGLKNTEKYLSKAIKEFIDCLRSDHVLLDSEIALFAEVIRYQELLETVEVFVKDLKELKEELDNDN